MTRYIDGLSEMEIKNKELEDRRTIQILTKYLLGDDWYIVDPVNNLQANYIIVQGIKNIYPPCSKFKTKLKWHISRWIRKFKNL